MILWQYPKGKGKSMSTVSPAPLYFSVLMQTQDAMQTENFIWSSTYIFRICFWNNVLLILLGLSILPGKKNKQKNTSSRNAVIILHVQTLLKESNIPSCWDWTEPGRKKPFSPENETRNVYTRNIICKTYRVFYQFPTHWC